MVTYQIVLRRALCLLGGQPRGSSWSSPQATPVPEGRLIASRTPEERSELGSLGDAMAFRAAGGADAARRR
jgi:hypothetical protein